MIEKRLEYSAYPVRDNAEADIAIPFVRKVVTTCDNRAGRRGGQ